MGLSISDAIRLLLVRVAAEKALPFEITVPNAEARATISELKPRADRSFDSVAELLVDLNAAMERCSGFAAWGWPRGVVVFGRNDVANFATFLWHCPASNGEARERFGQEKKLMPVFFLQKQEARRQVAVTEGQFERSGAWWPFEVPPRGSKTTTES